MRIYVKCLSATFRRFQHVFPTSQTYDEAPKDPTRLGLLCCSWQTTVASKRTSGASVLNRFGAISSELQQDLLLMKFISKSLSQTFVDGNTRQNVWACFEKENSIQETTADSHDTSEACLQWFLAVLAKKSSRMYGWKWFEEAVKKTANHQTCLSRRPFIPDIIMKPTKSGKKSWFVQIDM